MQLNYPIASITPFTMQDFPGHLACIIWAQGCNMRCTYCHNPNLVIRKQELLSTNKVFEFLLQRQEFLEGVVISGGECTLSKKLPKFITQIKDLGYKVKIDTNGSNPKMLEALLANSLIDYVALDYKAPLNKFYSLTNYKGFTKLEQSLFLLQQSKINYEVRTTIHTNLLNESDVNEIIQHLDKIKYTNTYYVQNYEHTETIGLTPPQQRELNPYLLVQPKNFTINLRNFA